MTLCRREGSPFVSVFVRLLVAILLIAGGSMVVDACPHPRTRAPPVSSRFARPSQGPSVAGASRSLARIFDATLVDAGDADIVKMTPEHGREAARFLKPTARGPAPTAQPPTAAFERESFA